jgi:hypothetical protein
MEAEKQVTANAEPVKNKKDFKADRDAAAAKKVRAYKHKLKKFHEDSVLALFATHGS